jgi:dolichol-phosphate mannosyltransferase
MEKQFSVSVVVPVYNEALSIHNSIDEICTFMRVHFKDFEVVIIESGSYDGSDKFCDQLSNDYPEVIVYHEKSRNGFGSALKKGYKKAVKDLVWVVPVDIPFPLITILEALPFMDTFDCVLSFRLFDDRSKFRRLQSFIYNGAIKFLLDVQVKHINSAFKVFKRTMIQHLKLDSNSWFLDTEIICRLKEKKINYVEIPVKCFDRINGESKVSLLTPYLMIKEAILFKYL